MSNTPFPQLKRLITSEDPANIALACQLAKGMPALPPELLPLFIDSEQKYNLCLLHGFFEPLGFRRSPEEVKQAAQAGVQVNWLKHITELTFLDRSLARGKLKVVPPEIGQLKHLYRLTIYNQPIRSLPPEIGQLEQLGELYVCNTLLENLPSEITNLYQLSSLNLSFSNLDKLPPEIGQLQALESLKIQGTLIEDVPPTLLQIKGLQWVTLSSVLLNNTYQLWPQFPLLKRLRLPVDDLLEVPPEIIHFFRKLDPSLSLSPPNIEISDTRYYQPSPDIRLQIAGYLGETHASLEITGDEYDASNTNYPYLKKWLQGYLLFPMATTKICFYYFDPQPASSQVVLDILSIMAQIPEVLIEWIYETDAQKALGEHLKKQCKVPFELQVRADDPDNSDDDVPF